MQQRMKRAKMMNRVMTVVFYAIAGFFLLLLVAFAGKVIIGGLMGAKPECSPSRVREALEISCLIPFYLVLVALICSVPIRRVRRLFIWLSTRSRDS